MVKIKFMILLKICFNAIKRAFLHVIRTPRRSFISIVVIALGCVSMVLFGGFVESMYDGMRENMIHSQLGHIQIFAKGFHENGTVDPEKFLIPSDTAKKIIELLKENPNVITIAKRLHFNGLVSNGKQS